jgi:hypothetical protein
VIATIGDLFMVRRLEQARCQAPHEHGNRWNHGSGRVRRPRWKGHGAASIHPSVIGPIAPT